ncbi:peptide-methionine (S)-S-oxide reductase [Helicobacter valdiviensis]|uniref:Peptide methionine sulfoxide reductase MsrA n=1 Tax=Helicobacter valdiviensis TaxID=1458358 RepID=A0A2W6MWV3_9HELI|nr:peptide-methionine (S)-S-oxide reductase MsrA [Helicobacter valdiviensis]PZT48887.1 peptide-methionine (S)-S-oxide reductase [Helicobacter valdiviensis]
MQQMIYLAGGCFWGIQGYFDLLAGSLRTRVGYANSKVYAPNYEMVCSGESGAVEALELIYDAGVLPLEKILKHFFKIIDPCALNFQGNDYGTQYRSGIYVKNSQELPFIQEYVKALQQNYSRPIVTEIKELENFFEAEEYHQKYLAKNPLGYCHIDLTKAYHDEEISPEFRVRGGGVKN